MSGGRPSPIERFLGSVEAAGGPFALLALPVEPLDDDAILNALDRQIDRVNAHVERDTPEADEVRLALHAAAAQLLDPVVRRHLLQRWSATQPGSSATPPRLAPSTPPSVIAAPAPRPASMAQAPVAVTDYIDAEHDRAIRQLERDALLVLSSGRGFDARARARLLALAHAQGLTGQDVVAALSALGSTARPIPRDTQAKPAITSTHARGSMPGHPPSTSSTWTPPTPGSARSSPAKPVDDHPAPPRQPSPIVPLAAIGLGAIGLVGIVVLAIALLVRGSSSPQASTPAQVVATPTPAKVASAPPSALPTRSEPITPPKAADPPAAPDPNDLLAITRDLSKASQLLDVDAAAAVQLFESGVTRLSTSWPRLVPDQLIAAVDAVVEFIYKGAATEGVADRIGQLVLAPADRFSAPGSVDAASVVPAVWSAAMAARLSQERDLPASVLAQLQARQPGSTWRTSSGREAFQSGMLAAMSAWPARFAMLTESGDMSGTPDAWRRWAEAVDMKSIDDRAAQSRMLLGGLDTLLAFGPEPDHTPAVAAIASDIIARVGWRNDDGSREWLLRAFDDPRFSILDVRLLTTALATRSRAEGVDATMVLSTSSDQADRAALRERYATAWGIAQRVSRGDASDALIRAATEALARPLPSSDTERMAQLARLATINSAASWIARGEAAASSEILDRLDASLAAALTPPQQGTPRDPSLSDGAFAERYLGARSNAKAKRDLLAQIDVPGQVFGPIDAEVIVLEAVAGQGDLSSLAQAIVRRHATDPNIVNALLERLPRLAKTPQSSSLIEGVTGQKLPPPKDASWDIAARRALVEAAIDRVASMGENASIDRLTARIALAYRDMASTTPLPERGAPDPGQASDAASEVFRTLRWRADRTTPVPPLIIGLDRIDRIRQARLAQARGPLQVFAAEQMGVLEVLVYATQAEHPAYADRLRDLLGDVAAQRRRADHIIDQLIETEAAITRVWLIRLGQGEPG